MKQFSVVRFQVSVLRRHVRDWVLYWVDLPARCARAEGRVAYLEAHIKSWNEQRRIDAGGVPGLSGAEVEELATLAEHAGRTATLAMRVLRYGWDGRRCPDAPTLCEFLRVETGKTSHIARQMFERCRRRKPADAAVMDRAL